MLDKIDYLFDFFVNRVWTVFIEILGIVIMVAVIGAVIFGILYLTKYLFCEYVLDKIEEKYVYLRSLKDPNYAEKKAMEKARLQLIIKRAVDKAFENEQIENDWKGKND